MVREPPADEAHALIPETMAAKLDIDILFSSDLFTGIFTRIFTLIPLSAIR
jgi:hypothetical protein